MSKCVNSTNSSCVVWDGQNIDCLDLCRGDTITDVITKLGQVVCLLNNATDVNTLNFLCYSNENNLPQNLNELLQWYITKLCELKNQPPPEPNIDCDYVLNNIYSCHITFEVCQQIRITHFPNDVPLWSPSGDSFVSVVVEKICDIYANISAIQNTINNIQNQITYILDNCCNEGGGGVSFSITPNTCVYPSNVTPPSQIDTFNLLGDYIFFTAGLSCCLQGMLGYSGVKPDLLNCNFNSFTRPSVNFNIPTGFCSVNGISPDQTFLFPNYNVNNIHDLTDFVATISGNLYNPTNGIYAILQQITTNLSACIDDLQTQISNCNCLCSSIQQPLLNLTPIFFGYTNSTTNSSPSPKGKFFVSLTAFPSSSLPNVTVDLTFSFIDSNSSNAGYPVTTLTGIPISLFSSGYQADVDYIGQIAFSGTYIHSFAPDDVYIILKADVKYALPSSESPTCIKTSVTQLREEWYTCGYVQELFAYTTE
jgi:hypothetical protein